MNFKLKIFFVLLALILKAATLSANAVVGGYFDTEWKSTNGTDADFLF